jgi:hypothetical protein
VSATTSVKRRFGGGTTGISSFSFEGSSVRTAAGFQLTLKLHSVLAMVAMRALLFCSYPSGGCVGCVSWAGCTGCIGWGMGCDTIGGDGFESYTW